MLNTLVHGLLASLFFLVMILGFYFYFMRYRMDHWLEFYAHYKITYRKELKEMRKYFDNMSYISQDAYVYIQLLLDNYEAFINDSVHLDIFRHEMITKDAILEYRTHLASFLAYLDTNAKAHNLKAVHRWFLDSHKEDLLLLMEQLPQAAESTSSPTTRRILCGNLLLDFIDRFLNIETLVIKKNNKELDAIRHHMKNEQRCDIISSVSKGAVDNLERSAHI